jgi:micrococcal nuclease
MKDWREGLFPSLIFLTILSPIFLLLPLVALSGSQGKYYRVQRAVDGDTLLLTNGERVRLIGVDTPEVHESKKLHRDAERTGRDIETIKELGKKASKFTKSLVDRKEVRLEYDQANAHIKNRDKYGRVLAYVYLKDGTFVNAEIIRQGYGFAYTLFPFRYMEEFRRCEREARENERGLWGE